MVLLAQQTGWSLNELMELTEDELLAWLDTARRVHVQLHEEKPVSHGVL